MCNKFSCPQCDSFFLFYDNKNKSWLCENCHHIFIANNNINFKRIFISYGRDEYAELAEKIKNDLKKRGHEVWFDKERLREGQDWENYIEDGLNWVAEDKNNGRIVFLLTPHSTRRPDGYCLNEIAKAIMKGISIVPIMVVFCEPPLSICRIQWLDMQDCYPVNKVKDNYYAKFDRLLLALENDKIGFDGTQNQILNILKPIEFRADVVPHLREFTGRQWLFKEVDTWFKKKLKPKIFWIVGLPGVGKTALSAWLRDNRREISAYHFCNHLSKEKSDPVKMVKSIAYQLSTQLIDYQTKLQDLNLEWIVAEYDDAKTLFDVLITQPLLSIPTPDRSITVLIDGLDETTKNERNELALFIGSEFDKTPCWFHLIVTSRPDNAVLSPLQKYNPYIIDTGSEQNKNDIRQFLKRKFSSQNTSNNQTNALIEKILENSEGVFLYAKLICESIEQGNLSANTIEEIPKALSGVYDFYFSRQFPEIEYYKSSVRNVLGILVAAKEPLSFNVIRKVANITEEDMNDVVLSLGSLFRIVCEKLIPFHQSIINWLTDKNKSFYYYVSIDSGNQKLADYGVKISKQLKMEDDYFSSYGPFHVISAELWNEFINMSENSFFDKGCSYFIKEALQHDKENQMLLQRLIDYAIIKNDPRILKLLLIEIEKIISLGYYSVAKHFLNLIDSLCISDYDKFFKWYLDAWLLYIQGDLYEANEEFTQINKHCKGALSQKVYFIYANIKRELGDYTRSKDMYKSLYDNSTSIKNDQRILYSQQYADILYVQGKHHLALTLLKEFEEESIQDQYPLEVAETYRIQGHIYRMNEQFVLAEKLYDQALELFAECGSLYGKARIQTNYSETFALLEPEKAVRIGLRAIESNSKLSIPIEIGKAQNSLGLAYLALGHLDRSMSYFSQAEILFKETGYQSGIGMVFSNRLLFHLYSKDFSKANVELEKIRSIFKTVGSYPFLVYKSAFLFSCFDESSCLSKEIREAYSNKTDWLKGIKEYEIDLLKTYNWLLKK